MDKSCLILKSDNVNFSDALYEVSEQYIKTLIKTGYKTFYIQKDERIIRTILNIYDVIVIDYEEKTNDCYLNLLDFDFIKLNNKSYSIIELMKKCNYSLVFGLDWSLTDFFNIMLNELNLNYSIIYSHEQIDIGNF